ncbi:MAG TPA: hypothetical protein VFM69_07905 [Pricia sp.]|nr:hypothetical protein [Pricia sp.]
MGFKKINQWLPLFLGALAMYTAHSQEGFKIGAQAGLPLGEYNDRIGVVVGADMGYSWAPGKVVDLGIKAGFIHGFAERFNVGTVRIKLPSIQFAPMAATLRIWPTRSFSFGGEVGHAFGLNEGNEGGFYYRPQIGFQTGPQSELNLSYTAIDHDNETWSTVTLGYVYTFLSARHFR